MAEFWKITPSGNPTLLLRAEDVAVNRRVEVAQRILSPLHLGGEQAGFVRLRPQWGEEKPRLDMMGGEFCLNATRAFGALLAWQGLLPLETRNGANYRGKVEVSGASDPIVVEVLLPHEESAHCYAWASLNFATLPSVERDQDGLALVRLPGICHIILENRDIPSDTALAVTCAQLRQRFGLNNEEAVGCMWLKHGAECVDGPVLHPAVWVRAMEDICLESACGSGTLACALVLAQRMEGMNFRIQQPSGDVLQVEIHHDAQDFIVRVGGPVRLVAQGEVMVEPYHAETFKM